MSLLSFLGPIGAIYDSIANANSQAHANDISMQFQREMYQTQRKDALADWNMINAYNSPQAQMERYKAAGLNPNLVYGSAGSGAAPAVRSSSGSDAPNIKAPQTNFASVLPAFFDLLMKKQTTDNLVAQKDLIEAETRNKNANTHVQYAESNLKNIQTAGERFDLGLKNTLRETSVDAAKENLRKTTIENDVMLQRNLREAALNKATIGEVIERTLKQRAERLDIIPSQKAKILEEIEILKKDGTIKDREIELNKMGTSSHDALPFRAVAETVNWLWRKILGK